MHEPDFESLFRASPADLLALGAEDPRFPILAATDSYARSTLTDPRAISGRSIFDVFPDNPADPAATGTRNLLMSLRRVLATRQPDTMAVQKYDIRRPDDPVGPFEERWWSCVNAPVIGAGGEVVAIIHRANDVTDFVTAERRGAEALAIADALRTRAGQMELDIVRRAQEIQAINEQLETANAQLSRLDQMKSDFFAGVSHEFRTPLALILGPLETLLAVPGLSSAHTRTLQVMAQNARLLQRHVNDLLDVARLDAGRLRLHYSRTDLARLVRLAASHFESAAGARQVRLVIGVTGPVLADVDANCLQRVVINLLSNALAFVPPEGTVRCSLREDGECVVLEVADSGPGIEESRREAVFIRFDHGGRSGRRVGGMGLGLSIVRGLLELHGGTVSAGEAPEGGALLTVRVPRRAPAGAAVQASPHSPDALDPLFGADFAARLAPATSGTFGIRPEGNRPTVLVVEDNRDMNRFICEVLAADFLVVNAFNGDEGLEEARATVPDAIVSDVMMPGMSGTEFVREVAADPELRDVPVLLLTANADDAFRAMALRHGARDFLVKPFSPAELRARVANLLQKANNDN